MGRVYNTATRQPACYAHRAPVARAEEVHADREDVERFDVGATLLWVRYRKGGATYGEEIPVTVRRQSGHKVYVTRVDTGADIMATTDRLKRPTVRAPGAKAMRPTPVGIAFR